MKIAHIFTMGNPLSLYAPNSSISVSVLAAMQAVTRNHDVTIYGPSDSAIIEDAKRLAKEKFGMESGDIELEDDGKRKSVSFANGGKLTLRTTGQLHTLDERRLPLEKRMELDEELYKLAVNDEKENPSDVFNVHDTWFTGYLAKAGLTNAVFHAHMNASFFSNITGERLKIAQKLGCNIENGQLVPSLPVIAISQANAKSWEDAGAEILDTIWRGILKPSEQEAQNTSAGYLLCLGRLADTKGVLEAIKIAKKAKMPLVIAGNAKYPAEKAYFAEHIEPYIKSGDSLDGQSLETIKTRIEELRAHEGPYDDPPVIFVGEAVEEKKSYLYQNAYATILSLAGEEAFCTVTVESMLEGCPVIAYEKVGDLKIGPMEEIIDEGITGARIIADNAEQAIEKAAAAVATLANIDREKIQKWALQGFTSEHEVEDADWIYAEFTARKFLEDYYSPEERTFQIPEPGPKRDDFTRRHDIFMEIMQNYPNTTPDSYSNSFILGLGKDIIPYDIMMARLCVIARQCVPYHLSTDEQKRYELEFVALAIRTAPDSIRADIAHECRLVSSTYSATGHKPVIDENPPRLKGKELQEAKEDFFKPEIFLPAAEVQFSMAQQYLESFHKTEWQAKLRDTPLSLQR